MNTVTICCAIALSVSSFGPRVFALRPPTSDFRPPTSDVRPLTSDSRPPQDVTDRDKHEAVQHYRAGQDALRSEKYEEAEREFQRSIKLDPTYELPRYGLGQTYMAMKRYPDAVTAFQKCRDVFHGNAIADSSDDVKRQRRIDDTIKELEDQKRTYSSPGHIATGSSAGTLGTYMKQLDMQINSLKEARARRTTTGDEPTPAWLSLALGSAYFRTNAYADAEREYRAATAVNPKLGEAHNNLAVVLLVTGRPADAQAELEAAEKAGYKVNPQLKEDVRAALKK
jgi:Flp pilus assembly protein TadD